jgi:hypothetical protein
MSESSMPPQNRLRFGPNNSTAALFNETMERFQVTRKMNQTETKIKEKIKKMPPVLSLSQLKNLDDHKYSSGGSTLLDPIFQPYWRWLVEQMPLWLAPNLITIIGLIINVLSCSILYMYSPNGTDYVIYSNLITSIGLFA